MILICLTIAYAAYEAWGWWEEIKFEDALRRAQGWRPPSCTCIPGAMIDNPKCPDHGDL